MTKRRGKGQAGIGESPAAKIPKNILTIERQVTKSDARVLTELGMSPIIANANTTRIFGRPTTEDIDITEAVAVVREKANAVQAGNLAGLEETLTAQAVALDAIFNEMARRTALNMADYLTAAEIYLRLGLKAQAQCRATIQTLAEMKNPHPVAFVKQANFANGAQQVNNGVPASGSSSRGEIPTNSSNELLGLNHEQRLDTGTSDASGGLNPRLETVDAIDWSEDRAGQGREREERAEARDQKPSRD